MAKEKMDEKRKEYLWDGAKSEEILVYRRMCYDLCENVLRDYSREHLKEIYLKFYYQLDKRSRNFWKIILEIPDEEIEKKAKKISENPVKSGIIEFNRVVISLEIVTTKTKNN